MRYAIPALFIFLAFLVLQSWFTKAQQLSPEKEVLSFLSDIQKGNVSKVVRHFGTNICHCPKTKGWGAYLAYETDEEPNLAFLLKHPFNFDSLHKTRVASSPKAWHGVPWEAPEDYIISVHVFFDSNKYKPFFLPLPMAYGKDMTQKDFEEFIAHPDWEFWKSFTLRLRPSLAKGTIKFDPDSIDQDVRADFKFITMKKKTDSKISWYLAPKDAGAIIMPDGKIITAEQVQDKLPRLASTVMELHIVRSAQLQPWSIADFSFKDPILYTADGHILRLGNHWAG